MSCWLDGWEHAVVLRLRLVALSGDAILARFVYDLLAGEMILDCGTPVDAVEI